MPDSPRSPSGLALLAALISAFGLTAAAEAAQTAQALQTASSEADSAGSVTTDAALPPGAGLRTPAQACRIAQSRRDTRSPVKTSAADPIDERLQIEADRLSGEIGQTLVADGQVQLQRGRLSMQADHLTYAVKEDRVQATGGVQVWRELDYFAGRTLDLDTVRSLGFLEQPRYRFDRTQAGGHADRIEFQGTNRFQVLGATYSSCEVAEGETPAWELTARSVKIDVDANTGVATGGVLRFQGVPILAWPVLSFPVTEARKSGLLPPQISVSTTSGFEFGLPYYFNLAPDQDATLTPVLSVKRSLSLDGEYRYQGEHASGVAQASWSPYDPKQGAARWALNSRQAGTWSDTAGYNWQWLRVSDNDYWKDGLRGAESLTPRLLGSQAQTRDRRTLDSDWLGEVDQWLYARVQRWQVLQSSVAADAITSPYQRAPQIGAQWQSQNDRGPSWVLQTEANRFTNIQDGLDTGSRAHAVADLSWPLGRGGWTLTPRMGVNAAAYSMAQPLSDGRLQAARVIPSYSLDSAWTLDRPTSLMGRALTQTLEPRLQYVRTPWRNLSTLPNFDSARLDFNTVSLFEPNAFSGVDWVSEANQVTVGLGSRFLDAASGVQVATLGIAERYLLVDPRAAPDNNQPSKGYSDLFVQGSLTAVERWSLASSVQYKLDVQRIERSISTLSYTPGPFRTVSVSHSLQRDASEQVGLGWQWPLRGPVPSAETSPSDPPSRTGQALDRSAPRTSSGSCQGTLYGVGKLDYSLREHRLSGALAGLEYDAGCWIGRVVVERLSTGSATSSSRLMLQLELVGLSRLGSNPLGVLKDNIPGYTLLRDPSAERSPNPGTSSGSAGLHSTP